MYVLMAEHILHLSLMQKAMSYVGILCTLRLGAEIMLVEEIFSHASANTLQVGDVVR